jgi:metal-responsive CopG/Arc/MetJ family transcriptional regulator
MAATEKVTLTLPKDLMDTVREIAPQRGISRFVSEALEYFIAARRRQALRERLRAGYLADAALDREMAEEWRPLEEENWMRYVAPYEVGEAGDG